MEPEAALLEGRQNITLALNLNPSKHRHPLTDKAAFGPRYAAPIGPRRSQPTGDVVGSIRFG